jgi:hypothetical protein
MAPTLQALSRQGQSKDNHGPHSLEAFQRFGLLMRPLKAISGPGRALSWTPEAPDDLYKFSRPLKVFFKGTVS